MEETAYEDLQELTVLRSKVTVAFSLLLSRLFVMALEIVEDKLHIVMFPWLAFGHMIPYLELSKHIAGKGHRVSFMSTPRNIDRLPKIPQNLATLIDFVKIELPVVENLPQNAEATSDLPYDKVQYLKKAYDLLQEPVMRLLESLAPDWVLYDFAPYWIVPMTRKLGIKTAHFTIFLAASLVFFGPPSALKGGDYRKTPEDYTTVPEWVPFQSSIAFPYFAIKRIFDAFEENESGVSDSSRLATAMEGADIIAIKTSCEVESEWLKLLEEFHQKPVLPVGNLPPKPSDYNTGEESEAWHWIKQWLDLQKDGSVVYVAFGSEARPSQDEVTQIASGLEISGLPFFGSYGPNSTPQIRIGSNCQTVLRRRSKGRALCGQPGHRKLGYSPTARWVDS